MTDRVKALKHLLAKVEAGNAARQCFNIFVSPYDEESVSTSNNAWNAYQHSLDAAKALHEALLPGWGWTAWTGGKGDFAAAISIATRGKPRRRASAKSDCAAHAWLIAILKAIIAQEEKQVSDTDIVADLEKPWTSVAHWQALGGQAAAAISALQAENEALRAQAVTVKPLEWEHQDGNYPMWTVNEPVWGGRFEAKIDKSEPLMCGRFPLFINGRWDGKKHQNLKSAKAAAQADYERRILAAISALAEKEDG